jgi:hypothetical protein
VIAQGTAVQPVIWISGMSGSVPFATAIAGGTVAQGVTGVQGGISIGTDPSVNTNGVVYYAILIYADTDNNVNTGFYTGNATTNHGINTTNNQAWNMIITVPNGSNSDNCVFATTDMPSANSMPLSIGLITGAVSSIGTGLFAVGTTNNVNRSNATYAFLAMKSTANVMGTFSYAGTGNNIQVGNLTFTPTEGWVKGNIAAVGVSKYDPQAQGVNSLPMSAGAFTAAGIQGFTSTGFAVGTSNFSGANATNYYAVAFKETIGTISSRIIMGM